MRKKGKFVRNLAAWDLPQAEALEVTIVDELAKNARALYFDRELFADEFYPVFLDRLREAAEAVINETIEYWVKGLADGNDGKYPELCLEVPYLQGARGIDPLTIAYCVDNEDETRTELHRISLTAVLKHWRDQVRPPQITRMRRFLAELKALAQELETGL